jgi:aminoglycoside phosphotransferase (APT) family kinase protein
LYAAPPGTGIRTSGRSSLGSTATTRQARLSICDLIDAAAVTAAWETALAAPEWDRPPVWVHGDLDARNLLVRDARITGVLDWNLLCVGDPACDVKLA